ncbi:hypothetical protein ACFL38_02995 [Candidatus Omnitrophota bacterium]
MHLMQRNKGFLLISSCILLTVIAIFSTAIFSKSISEHLSSRENIDRLQAKYNALFGMELISAEARHHGSAWWTHQVDEDNSPYPLSAQSEILDLTFSSLCAINPTTGAYESLDGLFSTRLYYDKATGRETEIIILSQGISNHETYLLAAKVSSESLYQYFYFTPYELEMHNTDYLAEGGMIHSNEDIVFRTYVDIQKIGKLSAAGYIRYFADPYVPITAEYGSTNEAYLEDGTQVDLTDGITWDDVFYWYRDPWTEPRDVTDGNPYYHNAEGTVAGDFTRLLMENPQPTGDAYVECEGDFINCIIPEADPEYPLNTTNLELYTCDDYHQNGVCSDPFRPSMVRLTPCPDPPECDDPVDEVRIPNRLATEYQWDKYWKTSGGRWVDGVGERFYPDPTGAPETRPFYATNTAFQSSDWDTWLQTNNLGEIIFEHNSRGKYVEPLTINDSTYSNNSQAGGMYILKKVTETYPRIEININGELKVILANPVDKTYQYEEQQIAHIDHIYNVNSKHLNQVIRLDLEAMDLAGAVPDNGIIYARMASGGVALENASSLFPSQDENYPGLTVVTEEDVYLAGDFNNDPDNWRPAAVITANQSYVFTVSTDFFDTVRRDGEELPRTIRNPNYPYLLDGFDPENPDEPYWDTDGKSETDWLDEVAALGDEITPLANDSTPGSDNVFEYFVSLVGYRATVPQVLERWNNYSRQITGAIARLPEENFETQGFFDRVASRCCSDDESAALYPAPFCRDCDAYAGWSGSLTAVGPVIDNNIMQYEPRYNAGFIPPGELWGYSSDIMLQLPDTQFNRTHHVSLFSNLSL